MAKKPASPAPPPRSRRAKRLAKPSSPGPWTVMVYMAAELSADLDAHAVRDLREMEQATLASGVRVVVQINRHWPTFPQRYEIEAGRARLKQEVADTNTGGPKTLSAFLNWVLDSETAPANGAAPRQYCLVLWGHSFGLGFGRDHGDPLTLAELRRSLADFRSRRKGAPLELLGANACAIGYAEAAYELRREVRHLAASQIAVPFAGWPFEVVLNAVRPGRSSEEVGRMVVDRYVSSFQTRASGFRVAMSLLDLAQLLPRRGKIATGPDFGRLIHGLAACLLDVVAGTDPGATERLAHVRAAFLSAAVGDVRPLIDLKDVCRRLLDFCQDMDLLQPNVPAVDRLRRVASQLDGFLKPAYVLTPGADPKRGADDRFVVVHKHHEDLRGLNGVGIFAPFVTEPADLKRLGLDGDDAHTGRKAYERLGLVRQSAWGALVYDVLRAGIPPDVVTNIESTGTVNRADRAAVAQMLVAMDSLFDVLDRRVKAAHVASVRLVPAGSAALGVGPIEPDRFFELQLLRHKEVRKAAQKSAAAQGGASLAGPTTAVTETVTSLTSLEETLQTLERAVRRTLTNRTFGLGPGPGPSVVMPNGHGKGGGVHGDPRVDKGGGVHGAPDFDKGGGVHGAPDFDKGGGVHGVGNGSNGRGNGLASGPFASTSAAAIAGLFADVGEALSDIEASVGDVETLLALATASGGAVTNGGAPNPMQIDRAFRVVSEASTQTRRTLRRVLADPVYGFGPGPDAVGVEDRQELARAGGINSLQLKLL